MESLKRLQYINKMVVSSYPHLTTSNSSTLVMNYPKAADLLNSTLSNINYESKFKHQINVANQIGLVTTSKIKKTFDAVIVSVSKSKDESLAQIAIGYERAKTGGILIIEGSKRNGIETIIQNLLKFQVLEFIVPKDHGKIVVLKVPPKKVFPFSNWLDFDLPSKNDDGFYSIPGLFSYKRADSASKFLSTVFSDKLRGDVIDLGAGWGFLSSKLLDESLSLKSVTLIDHDQRALECAQKNIKSSKAKFKWMDIKEMNQLDSKFDTAICNPPFHSHQGIDIELGKSFIKAAHGSLKNTGSLLLVSNIQLPYEKYINNLFKNFTITAKNKYFKIILATKPKKYYDAYPSN